MNLFLFILNTNKCSAHYVIKYHRCMHGFAQLKVCKDALPLQYTLWDEGVTVFCMKMHLSSQVKAFTLDEYDNRHTCGDSQTTAQLVLLCVRWYLRSNKKQKCNTSSVEPHSCLPTFVAR